MNGIRVRLGRTVLLIVLFLVIGCMPVQNEETMAVTLQITDGTTTINLANTTGFELARGYVPVFAQPTGDGSIPPYVVEALPVFINITSDDNLAATMQDFHALQKRAAEYWIDPQQTTPVWFHRKLTAETGTVRTLVKSLDFTPSASLGSMLDASPAISEGRSGVMAIEHHPYWEDTSTRTFPEATPAAGIYAVYDYTAADARVSAHDTVGDVGARIEMFNIIPEDSPATSLGRVWAGFRSANKHGTVGNWVFIWELEDGTNNASESGVTDVVDATASGGDRVQVVETDLEWDDTWQQVLEIYSAEVHGNYQDNFGQFLWLLRGYVTAGTWEVRLHFGYRRMDDNNFTVGETVEITSTSWDFFEMAVQDVPLRDIHSKIITANYDQHFAVQLWARRVSGSGNLNVDCLGLVPMDEGWFKTDGFEVRGNVDFGIVWILESPEDGVDCIASWANLPGTVGEEHPPYENDAFYMPVGDGRLVIFYARETSSNIADQIIINEYVNGYPLTYYERWVSFRGAE